MKHVEQCFLVHLLVFQNRECRLGSAQLRHVIALDLRIAECPLDATFHLCAVRLHIAARRPPARRRLRLVFVIRVDAAFEQHLVVWIDAGLFKREFQ